jgi:hypothetical protein
MHRYLQRDVVRPQPAQRACAAIISVTDTV